MSVRDVVEKLKSLAEISDNRTTIARDERCLTGLIQFIGNPDRDTALCALETVQLLAQHPANKELLAQHSMLTSTLDKLLRNPHTSQSVQIAAQCIVRTMRGEHTEHRVPLQERMAPATPSKRTTEEWHVPEMTSQARRDTVQKTLMTIPGVVSVTINPITQRVAVFGSAAVDVLEKTIASTGMSARRPGGEAEKENQTHRHLATQELLDAEARKEKQRREEVKEKARTTSFFSRLGRALYLV
jgi:hypothetical protein